MLPVTPALKTSLLSRYACQPTIGCELEADAWKVNVEETVVFGTGEGTFTVTLAKQFAARSAIRHRKYFFMTSPKGDFWNRSSQSSTAAGDQYASRESSDLLAEGPRTTRLRTLFPTGRLPRDLL